MVIGFQIAVLDDLPFMPPDFTILLVVPVHRILLVAFPPAGRQLYPFPILVKVINLAALGKPFSMFIHCPHGQQDMGVGIVSRRIYLQYDARASLDLQDQKRQEDYYVLP